MWIGLGWACGLGGGGGVGWVGLVGRRVFYFVDTVLFCRTVFVGRWVAMVLTSSSCNLGIDNFDSRQVPNLTNEILIIFSVKTDMISLVFLQLNKIII